MNIENKLTENLQKYEKTIADIKKRQHELVQSIEAGMTEHQRSETPPRAPLMRLPKHTTSNNYPASSSYYASYPSTSAAAAAASSNERTKFSFQIKRPVKVDKFGLLRVATPLAQRSPSPRSRSRSHTPSRERHRYTRSRSASHSRSHYRSHSHSRSCDRWNRRRSRSYLRRGSCSRRSSRSWSPYRRSRSRTPRRTRSRSRSRTVRSRDKSSYGRRDYERTVSRGVRTSPPRHVNPKPGTSWAKRGGRGAARGGTFGNRVWRREDAVEGRNSNGRWLHDKYEGASETSKVDDGPSIEEIDEIINRAQKERKQEIIQRDKDILKKPTAGQF